MTGQRTQLRTSDVSTPEMTANVLNGVLKDLYLRIEALESAQPDIISHTFTTNSGGPETNYPLTFTIPDSFAAPGIVVRLVENLTDPTALNYEGVAVQDFTVNGTTLSIRYITGLTSSTQYRLTIEVKK